MSLNYTAAVFSKTFTVDPFWKMNKPAINTSKKNKNHPIS